MDFARPCCRDGWNCHRDAKPWASEHLSLRFFT
jgi:hypothetical protein